MGFYYDDDNAISIFDLLFIIILCDIFSKNSYFYGGNITFYCDFKKNCSMAIGVSTQEVRIHDSMAIFAFCIMTTRQDEVAMLNTAKVIKN